MIRPIATHSYMLGFLSKQSMWSPTQSYFANASANCNKMDRMSKDRDAGAKKSGIFFL